LFQNYLNHSLNGGGWFGKFKDVSFKTNTSQNLKGDFGLE